MRLPLLLRIKHHLSSPRNLEEYLLLFSLCCFLLGSIPNVLEWWSGDTSWVHKQRDLMAKRMSESPAAGGGRGAGAAATAAATAASERNGQEAASDFVIVPVACPSSSSSSSSPFLEESNRHHHQQQQHPHHQQQQNSSSSSLLPFRPPSPADENAAKVTFDDIVVTIITSSATMHRRLPLLYEAWIKDAPFPVVILTDSLLPTSENSFTSFVPHVQVRNSDCAAAKNGLICKTKRAFQLMHQEFGGGGGGGGDNEEDQDQDSSSSNSQENERNKNKKKKKWFLRLMDDTLVVLDNLLHLLNQVDANQSLCVGDLVPLANVSFAFFQGGAGWGLTETALDLVSQHWPLWDSIVLSGGHSPVSPGFMALSSFADDLFWGIFMNNFAAAGAGGAAAAIVQEEQAATATAAPGKKHIHMVSLPGWSGAPIDVKGGVVPCQAELQRDFCIHQVFPVGSLYWSSSSSSSGSGSTATTTNQDQDQAPPPPSPQEVWSAGACRIKMTKVGIVHMGLEVVGGRGGENAWVEQIVNVSRVFSRQQEQQPPRHRLVANFEDGPLYYWRLCRLMEENQEDEDDHGHDSSKKKRMTPHQKAAAGSQQQQQQQQLHMAIYNATTLTKKRLSEEVFHQGRMRRISIGLCQEPLQVVRQLLWPSSSSNATAEEAKEEAEKAEQEFLLLQSLTRLRDHLRFHLRPSAFDLHVSEGGENAGKQQNSTTTTSVQVVYRVGENATALAEAVCVRLNMAGNRKCLEYAVANMQRDLPWYLHYDHLCRRSGASVIEASQLQDVVV